MNLISKWLAGKRNYYVGAVLYNQFGKDDKLKKYFEGSPDKIKQDKLVCELQRLNQSAPALLQLNKIDKDSEEMPRTGEAVLDAMRNEWLTGYQKMQYLRHELDKYEGNTKEVIGTRGRIAKEILELEQECMAIWKKRDYYTENGRLPEVKPMNIEIPADPVELGKLIEAVKRNIRRNKQLASKHTDNPNYPLRAKEYENVLAYILKSKEDAQPGKK